MNFVIVAIAPWVLLLYAVLVIAGGVMGYLKAQSQPSLISGLISGIALLIAWLIVLFQSYNAGMGLAICLAIALLIVFALRFWKTRKFMPAGLMASLSMVCGMIFAIALFL
ncbi:small integral membrane protein [Leptolyngbyaceae cyanobacterium JSC-12]|nr:small integral membrane protein [Leptolyngbyaceae cyanobacterium JSC-12]